MHQWEKNFNALLMFILSLILWGALAIQFGGHETPCPLCYLQRFGMLGIAAGAFMNVRFGIHRIHYGFPLLAVCFGGFVALRQISLHICPGFPTFGVPFFGLNLYTWSFIIFASTVAFIALMLILFRNNESRYENLPLNFWHGIAFWMIFIAALANIMAASLQWGFFSLGEDV